MKPRIELVLAFLIAVASSADAAAQQRSVSGRAVSAATRDAAQGIRVELLAPDGAVAGTVVTQADGVFRFAVAEQGRYALVFRAIGYEPRRIDGIVVRDEAVALGDVELVTHALRLNPVVVTGSRVEERALEAPASTYTVDTREIQERPAVTAVDHVVGTPGVDVVTSGLSQHNVVARGFNNVFSGALFVLTDHRWASVPSLRFNAYNLIPATNEDVEKIEVVLGPGSALYGPNTSNGVMHILTRSPLDAQGTSVSLTGGMRSGDAPDGREVMQGTFRHASVVGENVGLKVSGLYFRGEDWQYMDPVEEGLRQLAIDGGADPGTLLIGARDFTAERFAGEARVDFRLGDETGLILSSGVSQLVNSVELTGIGGAQGRNWRYTYAQARFTHGMLFAQAYINMSDAGDSYTLRDGNLIVDNSVLWVGQLQHGASLGDRQRFTYGADFIRTVPRTEGTITGRNEGDDNITEAGVYLQSETAVSPLLDFVAAARVDYHDRVDKPVFSPRAAFVFRPTAEHTLRITYNRGFDQPTSNNLFLDISAGQLGPLPFGIRASGVPHTTGFTFRRDCAGDLCMRSPFTPGAMGGPATPLPLDATLFWDAAVQIFQQQTGIDLSGIPAPTAADVGTVMRALQPDPEGAFFTTVNNVFDVDPMVPTITNTFEAGYKGLVGNRLSLGIDAYFTRVENFVGPLRVETPNVFLDRTTLGVYLSNFMSVGQAAQIAAGMAGIDGNPDVTGIPLATVTPEQTPGNPADLILTYRNFGQVDLLGADVGAKLLVNDQISFTGSYSFVDKNIFRDLDGIADISLNAPKHKGSLAIQYRDDLAGLAAELRGRMVDEFPVVSGAFAGTIDRYVLMDANVSYALPFFRGTEISLTGTNILNNRHRQMVGSPLLGRLVLMRVRHSF